MNGENSRYRRAPWTPGHMLGCLIWPVVACYAFDPLFDLILGPGYFSSYQGPLGGFAIFAPVASSLIVATAVSVLVGNVIARLLSRSGHQS